MSAKPHVTIKFFGRFRESASNPDLRISLTEPTTVADVVEQVLRMDEGISQLVTLDDLGRTFAVALDHEYAAPDAPVLAGAELALIPPVSGG